MELESDEDDKTENGVNGGGGVEEDAFRCGVGAMCRCLTLLIHLEGEGDDGEATGEDLAFTASTSGFNLIVASSLAPEDIVGGRRRDGEDAAFSSPK